MPDMPRTKFNSPWTVANIEAELNGTKNARGALTMTEKLAQKVETSTYATDKAAIDAEIAEDRAALVEIVDGGAKNVANWSANTQTINNVQFVVENGSVTVSLTSGTTATARSQLGLSVKFQDDLETGTYVLSGAPKVTDGGLYLLDKTANARVTPTSDTGDGTVFTFNFDKTHKYSITVDVANGYSIPSGTTLVYKPMICTKAEWDVSHEYKPYALPNPTLTPAAIKAVDEGAKNLFRFNNVGRSSTYGASYTQNGITVTVDSDVGLTVSGTAGTGGAFVNIGLDSETPHLINTLCDGQHILYGGSAKARLNARANSQTNYSVYDTGNGTVLTATSYTGAIFVSVSVEEGVSFSSSETIYPMICTAADWAVSQKFVPYAPTNRELYEMIQALQSGTRSLSMQPEALTGEGHETESREEERR